MLPFGLALRAYVGGQTGAELTFRRDDGFEASMPVSHYFRTEDDLSQIETAALGQCRGHVLDVGAGTGIHSLVLQSRGLTVTALDVNPHAVEVMAQRGVREVQHASVFGYVGGPFDTVMLLGHGIGIVGDMDGLGEFLAQARTLVHGSGQLLVDSLDVSRTSDPTHLAYQESNRRAGRYIGEIRIQMRFRDVVGPLFGWLHVDPLTLERCASNGGWALEMLSEDGDGNYLARLTRRPSS
jgi:SAM-dependent methyltransferase